MKTSHKKTTGIDDYHRLEIEEIFTRTREHRNQRAQIYSFFGTAHLVVLGLAFNTQKISLMILAISLPMVLIIIDYGLKRALASVELRGLQLEELYAPDPEIAILHLSIAVSPVSAKRILKLKAINSIKDSEERISELRKMRPGFPSSIAIPLLVIFEIGMAVSFWFSGWKVF